MKWSQLLSEQRLGGKVSIVEFTEKAYPRSEFDKDYKRIIYSPSFRRLQDKTQVFPLDKNDFVRTRLTHSYETAAIANNLGKMFVKTLKNSSKPYLDEEDLKTIDNIPDILTCSSLLHDIGNPPFGHFGEEIIKKWFETNLDRYPLFHQEKQIHLEDRQLSDLTNFDGNAQALRVVTKLHSHGNGFGLNLTSAVLNSLIKYPTASDHVKGKHDPDYNLLCKKMGYFLADEDNFNQIVDNTGALSNRHPLTFLLEAADDIAYNTADIEDAFKKGLFTFDEFLNFVKSRFEEYSEETRSNLDKVKMAIDELEGFRTLHSNQESRSEIELHAIQSWISYLQEWLMYCVISQFIYRYDAIMSGEHHEDLFHSSFHEYTMEIISDVMNKFIYPNKKILKLELSANAIFSSLLDKFIPAVLYHDGLFESKEHVEVQAYKKIVQLISSNQRENYKNDLAYYKTKCTDEHSILTYDAYLRLVLVIDYLSGMTDSYAKSLYQDLNGMY